MYKTQFNVRRLLNCALSRMASAKGFYSNALHVFCLTDSFVFAYAFAPHISGSFATFGAAG